MTRKSHGLGLAAGAAVLALTFASADSSGALAQVTETGPIAATTAAEGSLNASDPVYISQEVVQPIDDAGSSASRETDMRAGSLYELVASTDTSAALSEQLECLAGAVYFEARGEPLAGQLAVAQVIINRSQNARFPSSYCGVVMQPQQFSFVRSGEMPRVNTGTAAWQRAKAIARIAHEGLWESEAGDALYFHAKYVRPSWSYRKVARATIHRHVFYR